MEKKWRKWGYFSIYMEKSLPIYDKFFLSKYAKN